MWIKLGIKTEELQVVVFYLLLDLIWVRLGVRKWEEWKMKSIKME